MSDEERKQLVDQGKALKEQLAGIEESLTSLEEELQIEGQKLPNSTHPDVRVLLYLGAYLALAALNQHLPCCIHS